MYNIRKKILNETTHDEQKIQKWLFLRWQLSFVLFHLMSAKEEK